MNSEFEILNSHDFMVGSARNLKPGGKLDVNARERISLALQKITQIYDFNSHKHIAVATEAFRLASDGELFLDEIHKSFGIKFKIIDAISEAKFIELAVKTRLKTLGIESENSLFIDLGGGSTEVSFNGRYKSFKFGIVRFYNEFGSDDVSSMQTNAKLVTKEAREFIGGLNPSRVVLTSSIPTNLAMVKFSLKEPKLANGKMLEFSDFERYRDEILNSSSEVNEANYGKDRAHLILAGIILLESFLAKFSEFIVIDDGLREGIIIDEILKDKI